MSTAAIATSTNVTAVLSMLHEPAQRNSATRLFRARPVLRWTLDRLQRSGRVTSVAIVCWEDQLDAVVPIAEEQRADVLAKGPRVATPELESVAAARRWSDGWRGGLLGTCEFDRGFHAGWTAEVAAKLASDAVLLVDPAAGLIDSELIDALIDHAENQPQVELCFMPAAPGLTGALLRIPLLKRLAIAKAHPGRLLHYAPDLICREVLGGDSCAPVPTSVARSVDRFTLDSDRQVERLDLATLPLNGQLIKSPAEDLVARMRDVGDRVDALPREVVLELNTERASRPIFWPGRHHTVQRPGMTVERAGKIFRELAASADDTRVTIAGVGDPMLSDQLLPILDAARAAGIKALHVETDLLAGDVAGLARSAADIVTVHVPALTPETYAAVMGVDRYTAVLENVRVFAAERARRGTGVPILVPTFMKCRDNLGEMEAWYDQWLRVIGAAVVVGPGDYAGQIPDTAVADMAPPKRRPCVRLASRIVVHSDGTVVSCEQDFAGRHVLGNVNASSVAEIWQQRLAPLRADHRKGDLSLHVLCGACREWNRP